MTEGISSSATARQMLLVMLVGYSAILAHALMKKTPYEVIMSLLT